MSSMTEGQSRSSPQAFPGKADTMCGPLGLHLFLISVSPDFHKGATSDSGFPPQNSGGHRSFQPRQV